MARHPLLRARSGHQPNRAIDRPLPRVVHLSGRLSVHRTPSSGNSIGACPQHPLMITSGGTGGTPLRGHVPFRPGTRRVKSSVMSRFVPLPHKHPVTLLDAKGLNPTVDAVFSIRVWGGYCDAHIRWPEVPADFCRPLRREPHGRPLEATRGLRSHIAFWAGLKSRQRESRGAKGQVCLLHNGGLSRLKHARRRGSGVFIEPGSDQ